MNRIILKKPDINSLRKKGYICFDMHVHSEYSSDSNSKVKEILKKTKELGIGIAITDHNEIQGCLEAHKLKKAIVIPAIEARSKEGFDILFYFSNINELVDFYKKVVQPNKTKLSASKLSALKLVERSKKYKSIVCIAHPYRPSPRRIINAIIDIKNMKLIFNKIKIFEVVSGKNFRFLNKIAIKISENKNKSIIGGSDSHEIGSIGGCVTFVKKEKKKKNIINYVLNEISSNNAVVVGKERNLFLEFMKLIYNILRK